MASKKKVNEHKASALGNIILILVNFCLAVVAETKQIGNKLSTKEMLKTCFLLLSSRAFACSALSKLIEFVKAKFLKAILRRLLVSSKKSHKFFYTKFNLLKQSF